MSDTGKNPEPENFKRWTAKRKAAVVLDVIKGIVTPAEVARTHGLTVGEIEKWVEEAMRGMEERLHSSPLDLDEAHQQEKKEILAKIGELSMEVSLLKKAQGIGSRGSGGDNW